MKTDQLPRTCGSCTLCCKVYGVAELHKPADTWCPSVQIGVGCAIYADRPYSCRTFRCAWLKGLVPEALRPDQIHGVATLEADGHLEIHEDPAYPGVARAALEAVIEAAMQDNQSYAAVVTGPSSVLLASPDRLAQLQRDHPQLIECVLLH